MADTDERIAALEARVAELEHHKMGAWGEGLLRNAAIALLQDSITGPHVQTVTKELIALLRTKAAALTSWLQVESGHWIDALAARVDTPEAAAVLAQEGLAVTMPLLGE